MGDMVKVFEDIVEKQLTYSERLNNVMGRVWAESDDRITMLIGYVINDYSDERKEWLKKTEIRFRNYYAEYYESVGMFRQSNTELITSFLVLVKTLEKHNTTIKDKYEKLLKEVA